MEWLNYHHLLYFWIVAREGGLAPAGRTLRLSHSTLSGQIRSLENHLGEKLFVKQGRRLVLTETGRAAARYAEEIFSLGQEMLDTVRGRAAGQLIRLDVGVADVVPKLVVRRLLDPAFHLPEATRVVCHEDSFERLLTRLALHELDVVIADSPVPSGSTIRAFNHLLGESGIAFFGATKFSRLARRFPKSLDGEPMLLPAEGTPLRRSLNQWFEAADVKPRVVAEFQDSALLKVVGAGGLGVFPAPRVVEREVRTQYGVRVLGRVGEVRERFWAISAERRIKNPAVVAICDTARETMFA